jgi:hypothetical protein
VASFPLAFPSTTYLVYKFVTSARNCVNTYFWFVASLSPEKGPFCRRKVDPRIDLEVAKEKIIAALPGFYSIVLVSAIIITKLFRNDLKISLINSFITYFICCVDLKGFPFKLISCWHCYATSLPVGT